MKLTLSSPVQYVKGIGEKRAALLKKLGVETAGDLVAFYPRAYEDRGVITPLGLANSPDTVYNFILTVGESPRAVRISGGRHIVSFRAYDDTATVKIVFFNQPHLKDTFSTGEVYRFRGKLSASKGAITLTSPTYEKADAPLNDIVPVYPLTAGLNAKALAGAVKNALSSLEISDFMPPYIIEKNGLCTLPFALKNIHFPQDNSSLERAKKRLSFDEFFLFSLSLINMRRQSRTFNGERMNKANLNTFLSKLPYTLTDAQMRAVKDIESDLT